MSVVFRSLLLSSLASLAFASSAHAAATAKVSSPCVAGTCEVVITAPAKGQTILEASFAHRGTFTPTARDECVQAGTPDANYARAAAGRCEVRGTLRTAGSVTVAWRLTDETGTVLRTRVVRVRSKPKPVKPQAWQVLCRQAKAGDKCQPGGGRKVPGGGEKVSHKGWPAITGVFWQVEAFRAGRSFVGGPKNDELLGRHGSDTIRGKGGKDVLWGDWDPKNNNTRQKDVLDGGPGNDWIYTSHGRNTVRGGSGKDYIWAYYGRGTIDCGPGFDTLRIKLVNRYRAKNCERIKNFCSFGSKPGNKGGCYKPGEKPRKKR